MDKFSRDDNEYLLLEGVTHMEVISDEVNSIVSKVRSACVLQAKTAIEFP